MAQAKVQAKAQTKKAEKTEKTAKTAKTAKVSQTEKKVDSKHPQYDEVAVTCSCGHTFKTRSTLGRKELHLEICSECHPFFTGHQKVVTAGRVEKFNQKYAKKAK